MKNSEPVKKSYLKEVSKKLICPTGTRSYVAKELDGVISEYLDNHPEATKEDLYREFGEPEAFAMQLSEHEDYAEILKRARKKARFWMILTVLGVIIAVCLLLFVVYLIKRYGGRFTVSEVKVTETITQQILHM